MARLKSNSIEIMAVTGIGEIPRGADLASLINEAFVRGGGALVEGDVLVVAQKAVSKAEGASVDLSGIVPSDFAKSVAQLTGKDPRVVEVVLGESVRIVRMDRGVIITETRHGLICANAGVDASNAPGEGIVTTLPKDPDASARAIREAIRRMTGSDVAVIVSDSFGRPWREGSVNIAVGVAGMAALDDLRGKLDDRGRPLRTSVVAIADELASAAQLAMGEIGQVPAAIVRGYAWQRSEDGAGPLKRSPDRDLFR